MSNSLKLSVPEGVPFIDYEREFDFPVTDVFRAHKDPDLVVQWLGPRGYKMEIGHHDFRTGGSYSYIHTGPEGIPYEFKGVFHTVRENDFAVQTFEFGGYPDIVSLDFMTFEDLGNGQTLLRGHSAYPTLDARDGMAQSGMERGMSEGYERVDELLSS